MGPADCSIQLCSGETFVAKARAELLLGVRLGHKESVYSVWIEETSILPI